MFKCSSATIKINYEFSWETCNRDCFFTLCTDKSLLPSTNCGKCYGKKQGKKNKSLPSLLSPTSVKDKKKSLLKIIIKLKSKFRPAQKRNISKIIESKWSKRKCVYFLSIIISMDVIKIGYFWFQVFFKRARFIDWRRNTKERFFFITKVINWFFS